jgi:hypothetical protein
MVNKKYITEIAESKAIYHSKKAKSSFEDKFKTIIELQKLDIEMSLRNPRRRVRDKLRMVWDLSL